MPTFKVTWSAEVDAKTPADAVGLAVEMVRNLVSLATWFHIRDMETGTSLLANSWSIPRIGEEHSDQK